MHGNQRPEWDCRLPLRLREPGTPLSEQSARGAAQCARRMSTASSVSTTGLRVARTGAVRRERNCCASGPVWLLVEAGVTGAEVKLRARLGVSRRSVSARRCPLVWSLGRGAARRALKAGPVRFSAARRFASRRIWARPGSVGPVEVRSPPTRPTTLPWASPRRVITSRARSGRGRLRRGSWRWLPHFSTSTMSSISRVSFTVLLVTVTMCWRPLMESCCSGTWNSSPSPAR